MIKGQAALRIAIGILSWPGTVFPASRIALQMSVAIMYRKSILQVAMVGESKGILLALAMFVRRFWTRMSHFSLTLAARPRYRFCGSVNRGLQ